MLYSEAWPSRSSVAIWTRLCHLPRCLPLCGLTEAVLFNSEVAIENRKFYSPFFFLILFFFHLRVLLIHAAQIDPHEGLLKKFSVVKLTYLFWAGWNFFNS